MKDFGTWLWDAALGWHKDNAMRMSSSLAYYTLLSLAPLLVLAVSIAGLFMGDEAARGHIAEALTKRLGDDAGDMSLVVEAIIESARDPADSVIGTLIGSVVLVVGASGAFGELQSAMNTIWEVEPKKGRGFWGLVRDRVICFTMVGSVALLLLALLLVWALMAWLGTRVGALPGGLVLWQAVDLALSIVAVTLLFALSYKTVPDVRIPFREVLPGAFLTALMFALGELALGLYLRYSAVPKPQGAAGSVIVLVVWVYYAGQILFYGAEFTKARAAARGVHVQPRQHAMRMLKSGRRATDVVSQSS
ncbi:MAG: hypothetical protein RL701_4404 [Pseudomonadota bacterium]